jgi:hypothetical protein
LLPHRNKYPALILVSSATMFFLPFHNAFSIFLGAHFLTF